MGNLADDLLARSELRRHVQRGATSHVHRLPVSAFRQQQSHRVGSSAPRRRAKSSTRPSLTRARQFVASGAGFDRGTNHAKHYCLEKTAGAGESDTTGGEQGTNSTDDSRLAWTNMTPPAVFRVFESVQK